MTYSLIPKIPKRWLLLLALLSLLSGSAYAVDYFGHPDAPPPSAAASATAPREPLPAAAAAAVTMMAMLPEPIRGWVAVTISWQQKLNQELQQQLTLEKDGASWRPAFMIVLLSFIYGFLHAIGPGHGKVVVGSYFLTQRARVLQGLAMSGMAALVQSLSAIILVGGLAALLHLSSKAILDNAGILEIVSYAAMVFIGLSMLWNIYRNKDCCAHADEHQHAHGSAAATEPQYKARKTGPSMMAGHVHTAACRSHHHDAQEPQTAAPQSRSRQGWRHVIGTGAAVGLRPCSGAILVLLFCLANDIFPVGVLAVLAMGLGVAITVSVVSLTTVGLHRLLPSDDNARPWPLRIRRLASFGGAAAITSFGVLQILLIASGVLTPMGG